MLKPQGFQAFPSIKKEKKIIINGDGKALWHIKQLEVISSCDMVWINVEWSRICGSVNAKTLRVYTFTVLCWAMLGCALYQSRCTPFVWFSYAFLCCAVLCCAVLCWAELCWDVLCCAVLCCAVLCYAMLCYAVLRYAVLRYATLGTSCLKAADAVVSFRPPYATSSCHCVCWNFGEGYRKVGVPWNRKLL